MKRFENHVPPFRRHAGTGQGYANLNGRRVYLGRFDNPATKERYDRLIVEWLASGRQPLTKPDDLTITELVARFDAHAGVFYRGADGRSREADNFRPALRVLRELYGRTPARDFGALRLKACRQRMVDSGWSRPYVNSMVRRLRHLFRWAASEQLVPATIIEGLRTVDGLRCGKTTARETEPIRPVPDHLYAATLARLTPMLRSMVELQRVTGMRPGELVILRSCDVDMSGPVWTYRPAYHKTQHRGRERLVFIGPKGQALLRPLLRGDAQAYVFSPAESERERLATRHVQRKTPLSCGNRPGSCLRRRPKKQAGEWYTTTTYYRAVQYACDAAFPPADGLNVSERAAWRREHRWSPNMLRHSFATEVRRLHGLEAAQVLLGHARCDVSQVYAERDLSKAAAIASKVG